MLELEKYVFTQSLQARNTSYCKFNFSNDFRIEGRGFQTWGWVCPVDMKTLVTFFVNLNKPQLKPQLLYYGMAAYVFPFSTHSEYNDSLCKYRKKNSAHVEYYMAKNMLPNELLYKQVDVASLPPNTDDFSLLEKFALTNDLDLLRVSLTTDEKISRVNEEKFHPKFTKPQSSRMRVFHFRRPLHTRVYLSCLLSQIV